MSRTALMLASALFGLAPLLAAPAAAASTAVVGDLPKASPANAAEFRRQADALYRLKEDAFARGDADTVVERFYARDAIAFGPEGTPSIGRDAFREEYRKVVQIATVKVEPFANHVGQDAAWEWVNFHGFPKDKSQKPFTFIMIFVFAKKDGQWVSGGDAYTVGAFPKAD
ncbi:MAG: nuclear transport factor 2 family protein [Pseudomonadota bacterium]